MTRPCYGIYGITSWQDRLYVASDDVFVYQDPQWHGIGTFGGGDFTVRTLMPFQQGLAAAGWLARPPGNNIMFWDGQAWSSFGEGLDGDMGVNAITTYGDHLVAVGEFTTSGARVLQGVAMWDGATWQPIGGSGVVEENSVFVATATYDGDLYVGGWFEGIGGKPIKHIARWNGSEWCSLGAGTNGAVTALQPSNEGLIVGGDFSMAGDTPARNIAIWKIP